MIKIAIIDDEREMLSVIENIISKMERVINIVELYTFLEAEQALKELKNGNKYDIILSDIEMDYINGLEFGKQIRKNHPEIAFIFITAFSEFAVRSYAIDAYQYVLKSEMEDRLPEVLYPLINRLEKEKKQYRLVGPTNDTVKLQFSDIIYIKKQKGAKYVHYITLHGEYRERIPIEQLYKELDCIEMVLVDRSYIVNMKHIVRINGNTIYLINNEGIVISKARASKVKCQIHENWS